MNKNTIHISDLFAAVRQYPWVGDLWRGCVGGSIADILLDRQGQIDRLKTLLWDIQKKDVSDIQFFRDKYDKTLDKVSERDVKIYYLQEKIRKLEEPPKRNCLQSNSESFLFGPETVRLSDSNAISQSGQNKPLTYGAVPKEKRKLRGPE